jgi:hypothetical protein
VEDLHWFAVFAQGDGRALRPGLECGQEDERRYEEQAFHRGKKTVVCGGKVKQKKGQKEEARKSLPARVENERKNFLPDVITC